jgi:hypothetical protein
MYPFFDDVLFQEDPANEDDQGREFVADFCIQEIDAFVKVTPSLDV